MLLFGLEDNLHFYGALDLVIPTDGLYSDE